MDWTKTPLGSPETWPRSLRTCVRIVLTSRQPMFVWWGRELINLYNDAYKGIVGGKHPDALGQPASRVWHEIWDQVGPRAESAIRDNVGTYDEALLLLMERNGYKEETYYTFSYSPIPDDDDVTRGLICANTDDTARIIGERQLLTLRDLAAQTMGAASAEEACERAAAALGRAQRDLPFTLIYLFDENTTRAHLRGASAIQPGHPAAPLSLALDDDSVWPLRSAVQRGFALLSPLAPAFTGLPSGAWDQPPKEAAIVPFSAAGNTGRAGAVLVGLNPYRLFDENYRAFLSLIGGQISAAVNRADAYQQERRRAEALAELDRAKTTFFSNVSHEFRTPLTLMLGPLEDAVRSPTRALTGKNLQTAHRNALRLLKLVNSLLDFSRIEAGRAQACYEPTDLSALTTDLASAFRSAIERAGLRFDVRCEPLPEPVFVDHDMWEKIVLNLLSNALKYTFEGWIALSLAPAGERLVLSVADSGTGIPEAELPHIFERFHRVQGSRARTHEGSGIGLALVNELVRLHGGEVAVESRPGAGTTFTVTLPRGQAHLPAERVGAPRVLASTMTGAAAYVQEVLRWLPDSPDAAPELAITPEYAAPPRAIDVGADFGSRLLVVDDNADMRDYLARLLGERWTVRTASDGLAALALARAEPPDLVLTDVMMPNLDGFGMLRELRADDATREVPVIMLSARAGEESRVDGLESGADDYLVKPFSARELMARVATHLQIARLRADAQKQRERLRDIFEQAPLPVAVLSGPELRFEVANQPFCEMTARSGLVGRTLREAFPEPGAEEAVREAEAAYRRGEALRVSEQSVYLKRRGATTEAIFSYVVQPIRDRSGSVDGIVVAATEVTDAVLARRRVESLRAAAEQANRAKDEFLSALSHELRTPLSAIVGWSNLLSSGAVPSEQRARALETIERNARMQARLIDDLLDLSRIEQGKLVLSVGPLEMVRVVEAAIEAVRPAADAKGIRLQPVLDSHATIVGDADRLQQVVWNLLSNAIKFTPRGGRVQVRVLRAKSYVEVAVADNGQGIDANFLPHVFDRFRQGDPSFTRRAGGLGLGLAIVRSLVELHGGNVTAQSDGPGHGATFTVCLPTAPLRADSNPAASERLPNAPAGIVFEAPATLKNLDVLVVDDEPETRELLRFVLTQCHALVTTAADAREALELLNTRDFDLLISDIGMPDEDGYSLIRKVRALAPGQAGNIPALALTAYARSEDRTQALRSGFNMHLAKPIDPAELLAVLEALVRGLPARR